VDDDVKNRIMFGALPRGVETLDLLAAVGRNTGSDSDHGYVFGHGLAAELLFRAVGKGHGGSRKTAYGASAYVDALIYPLCYCIRHYVELSLKGAIKRIRRFRNEKTPPNRDHRLQRIWLQFAQTCLQDRRLPSIAAVLKPLVDSVAAVDPTGQAFRYRSSLKGDVHHIETVVIHLRSTEAMFRALRKALDQLDSALEFLEWEYQLGTFTSRLSRADLVEIAKAVELAYDSKDKSWMKKIRGEMKQKFELSNSEFDSADKLIEKHWFLSNMSGVELPLKELTAETMYVLPWALAAFPGDDLLSEEEWVGIAGIVGVMLPYSACEDYDWELQRIAEEDKYIDKGYLGRKITHDPDRFLRALHKLGQPTLAAAFLEVWPEVGD
jgi:hypothetical protein